MIKRLWVLFLTAFPILVFAADDTSGSLSLAPPPSDYSVLFLGNIFGVVDGVLHGTGSQIMGTIFSVFNSAVLALGGIVIMYTLLVSTLNTAHEGQMLGQKWSSIWVPVRSTLGLALLIPKTSGYCLMQIFVMWVVVQGVGAADKVWASALSYLNRGGVIVQQQLPPIDSLIGNGSSIARGASAILSGQVCMLGLQTALENLRQSNLSMKQKGSGPCAGNPSAVMQQFCDNPVPDFLSSVNALDVQKQQGGVSDTDTNYIANMPNFESGSPYAFLNGICGNIAWNQFSTTDIGVIQKNIPSVTQTEINTVQISRPIAIQQMYNDLSSVAQIMINNNPSLNQTPPNTKKFSPAALQQFGVPYLSSGTPCTDPSDQCMLWGSDPSSDSAPIFNGTEFLGAVSDYNGIMLPSLNLVQQALNNQSASADRAFIDQATTQGWLMAGSYFIQMARLTTPAKNYNMPNLTDVDSGLATSSFDIQIMDPFGDKECTGQFATLCVWFAQDSTSVGYVMNMINGESMLSTRIPTPDLKEHKLVAINGVGSSTAYGFIDNSSMVSTPNEGPIVKSPKFGMHINIKLSTAQFTLPKVKFGCGRVVIMFFSLCLSELLGELFYNAIITTMFNFFLKLVGELINYVVMVFLSLPLEGMARIFRDAVKMIDVPDVNPIIALANMGVYYINFSSELWIFMVELAILSMMIPWFGVFIMPLIGMVMPLLLAWIGTMVAIGFITAYYIPFLPYMIFTFGSIGWLMAVIEAMVAAPIVALGITHPEGEGPFGKGEQAIMILMNVFLRPAMMVIGYIAAIALSYVAVWIINAGFSNVSGFLTGDATSSINYSGSTSAKKIYEQAKDINLQSGYVGWAGIYAFFFSILIYTTMYVTVVQKSFSLITMLPDKVMRWIGSQPESIGGEVAGWAEEDKKQVADAGSSTAKAAAQVSKQEKDLVTGGMADATEAPPEVSGSGE